MLVENYLKILNERRSRVADSAIMYHGSKIQNLKVIDPEKWIDYYLEEHKGAIWASWDKGFAAMFCINWRKNTKDISISTDIVYYTSLRDIDEKFCWGSIKLNKIDNKEHCIEALKNPSWMVVVPTRYKSLVMQPCSLYLIKSKNWVVPQKVSGYPWEWPEAYTKEPGQVIKEIKYTSVKEAYEKNGVKLLVENDWQNSTKWQKIFSKLKT